jgi:hypothetical protein
LTDQMRASFGAKRGFGSAARRGRGCHPTLFSSSPSHSFLASIPITARRKIPGNLPRHTPPVILSHSSRSSPSSISSHFPPLPYPHTLDSCPCHPLHVTSNMSHEPPLITDITPRTSQQHTSCIISHASYFTLHTSHFTPHITHRTSHIPYVTTHIPHVTLTMVLVKWTMAFPLSFIPYPLSLIPYPLSHIRYGRWVM